MKSTQAQKGFTLIELLVTIAIVGLLSSVLVTMVGQGRVKAREAKRKADLVQLQKALELYFNNNSIYPATGGVWYAATGGCGGSYTYTGATGYIPNLSPTFVGVLPADPSPTTSACSGYNYRSNGTSYKIISNSVSGAGGPESFPALGEAFYDSARPTTGIMITNNTATTSTCPSATTCW